MVAACGRGRYCAPSSTPLPHSLAHERNELQKNGITCMTPVHEGRLPSGRASEGAVGRAGVPAGFSLELVGGGSKVWWKVSKTRNLQNPRSPVKVSNIYIYIYMYIYIYICVF